MIAVRHPDHARVELREIVELAAPYAPFPPDIRSDTDILYITRTWSFTRAGELESSAGSLPKAP